MPWLLHMHSVRAHEHRAPVSRFMLTLHTTLSPPQVLDLSACLHVKNLDISNCYALSSLSLPALSQAGIALQQSRQQQQQGQAVPGSIGANTPYPVAATGSTVAWGASAAGASHWGSFPAVSPSVAGSSISSMWAAPTPTTASDSSAAAGEPGQAGAGSIAAAGGGGGGGGDGWQLRGRAGGGQPSPEVAAAARIAERLMAGVGADAPVVRATGCDALPNAALQQLKVVKVLARAAAAAAPSSATSAATPQPNRGMHRPSSSASLAQG